MKTKEYIKPDMMAVKVQSQAILAGSDPTINQASDDDYTKDKLQQLLDTDGNVWGE